jgi:hypothetical protein
MGGAGRIKQSLKCMCQPLWLTPIILVTQEIEIMKIAVQSLPWFMRPYLEKTRHKKWEPHVNF